MYHLYLIWVCFLQPHPLVQFSNNLVLSFERLFSARYHISSDQWGEYWKEKITDNSLANKGTSSGLSTIPSCTRALCRDANLKTTPEMSISDIWEWSAYCSSGESRGCDLWCLRTGGHCSWGWGFSSRECLPFAWRFCRTFYAVPNVFRTYFENDPRTTCHECFLGSLLFNSTWEEDLIIMMTIFNSDSIEHSLNWISLAQVRRSEGWGSRQNIGSHLPENACTPSSSNNNALRPFNVDCMERRQHQQRKGAIPVHLLCWPELPLRSSPQPTF